MNVYEQVTILLPMVKTSTFFYSVNNLASKVSDELIDTRDLFFEKEYDDVISLLSDFEGIDIRQEVVDQILDFAKTV